MFLKNLDGVKMPKRSLIFATCLALYLVLECASEYIDRDKLWYISVRQVSAANGNEMKRVLDTKELDKPKNINIKPSKIIEPQNNDWPPSKADDRNNKNRNRGKRIFIKKDGVKWPNRIIPFKISYKTYHMDTRVKNIIESAVNKFNMAGCVKWVPHTNQPNYVAIIGDNHTLSDISLQGYHGSVSYTCGTPLNYPFIICCGTLSGFRNDGVHPLHLSEFRCTSVNTALHEMMHVAGAMHVQNRGSDRHRVLSVDWASISKEDELQNLGFELTNAREYNLGSILQYGLAAGFYLHDPDLEYLTYLKHKDLTFYDKAELNAFYKCADDCINPPICQNGGFVKQVRGVCSCECFDGLSGPDCTRVDTSAGCGGTINLFTKESELIDMVGYKTGLTCTWLIKGPKKTKIQVYVNSLGLPPINQTHCYHYLEIRDYLSGAPGKLICGNSGGATFTKQNLGPTNIMIVRFDSDRYKTISPGNGFILSVTATPSACSSSPCKYPAKCEDGASINNYTCLCTGGYSGTNCDTVAANATVTDSFERDFSTLMTHGSSGGDVIWFTKKYWDLNGTEITASDGYLMGILVDNVYSNSKPYGKIAKLKTSAVFERANRCLRFDYALADNNNGGNNATTMTVRISSDSGTSNLVFNTTTGNNWTSTEIDLPAGNNMKIEFDGVYGQQHIALDNISITPLLCHEVNPCESYSCQNGGTCELVVNRSTLTVHSHCSCQIGFSGQYCEKYICTDKSCLNGVCFPLSSSTYTCDCDEGWSGDRCDIYTCANVKCNQGRCEALSETETRCVCDNGWHGLFCDKSTNPCDYMPCKNGVCEVMSITEARCVCNSIHWIGKYCDIRMFKPRV